jgi:hypothetical protein
MPLAPVPPRAAHRRSLQRPSPLAVAYCRFPEFQLCRPPGLILTRLNSPHLHYGLFIALSTLNPCRYFREPKTRFPVGRLFPLPGRELHPLEAPGLSMGLSWRTEDSSEVRIWGI